VAVHDATLQVQRIDAQTYNGLPDEEHIRVEDNFIELTHLVVAIKREMAFMTLALTGSANRESLFRRPFELQLQTSVAGFPLSRRTSTA
jgi:hypothetical protein